MNQDNLGKRTFAALQWSYAGAAGRVLFQIVIQMLLARFLGPKAYGDATAAFFILAIGWLMAEAGFGSALVQKSELTDHDIAYAIGWVLLVSIVAALVVVALSLQIASLLGNPNLSLLVLVSGLLIPLQALSNIPMSLLRRSLDMKSCQIIQVVSYIFAYGFVGLAFARYGAGAWSLVIAFASQSLISLIWSYAIVRHPLKASLTGHSSLRNFGLRVTATNMANWAIDNLDRIVITRYWGTSHLGEYAAASNLSRSPATLLVSSAQAVMFAAGSRAQNDLDKLRDSYLASVCIIALITFPSFAYLALHSNLVIQLIYGDKWHDAAPLFMAFCVGLPFFAILSVTGPALWAIGAVASEMKAQIICAILLCVGFLSLIDLPLTTAVWLVPLIYVLRLVLVYRPLAIKLKIRHRGFFRAMTGGLIFTAYTFLFTLANTKIMGNGLLASMVSVLLILALSFFSIHVASKYFFNPELINVLLSQKHDSKMVRIICKLTKLGSNSK